MPSVSVYFHPRISRDSGKGQIITAVYIYYKRKILNSIHVFAFRKPVKSKPSKREFFVRIFHWHNPAPTDPKDFCFRVDIPPVKKKRQASQETLVGSGNRDLQDEDQFQGQLGPLGLVPSSPVPVPPTTSHRRGITPVHPSTYPSYPHPSPLPPLRGTVHLPSWPSFLPQNANPTPAGNTVYHISSFRVPPTYPVFSTFHL